MKNFRVFTQAGTRESRIACDAGYWWPFLVLACLLVFWGISLERSYAYLGLQSQVSTALIARNLHPLSADFALSFDAGLDWRRQLIGWQQQPASFENSVDGLVIEAQDSALDLRFPFNGAQIDVQDVKALQWSFATHGATPEGLALIVHADTQSPGWIAELPAQLKGSVDLHALEFALEPERIERRRWQDLPKLGFARLYLDPKAGSAVILQQLAWVGAPDVSVVPFSLWPPTLLNQFEAKRVAGTPWPTVSYRGVWLRPPSLHDVLIGLAGLAWLSQFRLWRRRRAEGASAEVERAACMGLSFLPTIAGLCFDASLGADAANTALMVAPVLTLIFVRLAFARPPRAALAQPWESVQHVVLVTGSLAIVALIGFSGLGPSLSQPFLDARMALSYLLFAGLQQMLLQGVVLATLERTTIPRAWVVILAAAMFAFWHLPNLLLMLACFIAALLWCSHFLRFRSVLPLILSHAVLGWLLSVVFPQAWLRSAKIGVMYFW